MSEVKLPNEKNETVQEAEKDIKSRKKNRGNRFILTLLKWIALVIAAVILIVTVVVITMKIMGTNNTQMTVIPMSEEYVKKTEILDWYQSLQTVKTRTIDVVPANVVVDIAFGYKTGDKITSTEITQRQVELYDFLRRYFSQKTLEELRPQNEDKIRIEIRNSINDDILTNSKIKDVRFKTFDVISQ